ncbi:hypothetical protein HYQ45_012476 [Verticillium longisporum]|uniref:Zn(2)-C6 fungal-type domain-containing protein n=1 Tax=Verticillium longisporum TaxID=100787 RepID=A0A8I3AK85_VERLO|nr:hypothetical protein HYQ45_012476 [Verticillium longisporum]
MAPQGNMTISYDNMVAQGNMTIPYSNMVPQDNIMMPQGNMVLQDTIMSQGNMVLQDTIMSQGNIVPQGNMVLQDTIMSQGNMVPQGNMMIPQGNMAPQPSFLHVPAQSLSSPFSPTNNQAQDYSYQQRKAEFVAAVQTQRQESQRANRKSRSGHHRRGCQARIQNNGQSQSIPAVLPEGLIDNPVAPVAVATPVVETTCQDPGHVDPVAVPFDRVVLESLFSEGESGGLFGEGDFENLFGDDELEAFFGESGGEPDTGTANAGAAIPAPSPLSLTFSSSPPGLSAMVSDSVPERTPVSTSPAMLSESTSPGTEQPAKKRRNKIGSQSCEMCRKSRKACHRQENTYSCVRCHTAGMPCNKFDPSAAKPSDGRTNNTVQRNHQRIYDEGRSVIEKLWKALAAIVPQSANEAPELVARRLALAQGIHARMPANNVESWVPITDMDIEALGLAMHGLNFRPDCLSIVGGPRSYVERPSRCEKLVEERKACHDLVDKVSRFVTALVDCIVYAADPSHNNWLPTHVANLLHVPRCVEEHISCGNPLSLAFKKHLGNIVNNAATD